MELTTDLKLQKETFENKTYKLLSNKIESFVDGMEAVKQSIYKTMSTERYEYPVYSFKYGIAWKELVGEEQPYVRAELKRMVEEALMEDDRILEIDNFDFEFLGDICHCRFQVTSIYGKIEVEKEVEI